MAELAAAGVRAVCVTPGSRSTPLTVAAAASDDITVISHLDERSSAYFALGRARRTGRVTPLICTSGTAAANFHPAVMEANQSRVPLLALTADRPPELQDSGANQTADQTKLYGGAVRWFRELPEPAPDDRKLRALRTTVARAVTAAESPPAGPVHLNVPLRKPLEPVEVPGDVPDLPEPAAHGRDGTPGESSGAGPAAAPSFGGAPSSGEIGPPTAGPTAAGGSGTPYVRTTDGHRTLDERDLQRVASALSAERGLLVAGPADPPGLDPEAVTALAHATGFPLLADPLSGLRFGSSARVAPVVGGYDAICAAGVPDDWPDPSVVVRFGASPTSKPLRKYLARVDARQFVVDPAGGWREAEYTASDLLRVDPSRFAARVARHVSGPDSADWRERWERAEETHWNVVAEEDRFFEGRVLADVCELAPEPTTLFVSNSMPVRDLDRFGEPQPRSLTVLGNRGVSGIDGIVSTALGAGSATTDRVTLVIGDLAYYHDMNGLLAAGRAGVDATIVLINNDGGGIFHLLPIAEFDPPFTEQFVTPHGLDFEPTGELYDLQFTRVEGVGRDTFRERYREASRSEGTHVIEVTSDADESHRVRTALERALRDEHGG